MRPAAAFSGTNVQIVVILTEEETEETAETEKAITDIAVDPYYVLMGFAARAAADNTIAYPTMTPAAYAKTDSRFTVIRPEKFTLNGEYEFCARVLYSGKAYENKIILRRSRRLDRGTIRRWAIRRSELRQVIAQLQNAYKTVEYFIQHALLTTKGKEKLRRMVPECRYL